MSRIAPGTAIDDLQTPVLVIDLDELEHNIGVIAAAYRDSTVKLRPHIKNHKSTQIAWQQINAGGTVGGVCSAKVSEAEVFVEAGVPNVLIANQIVHPDKIRRLASLALRADMMVAIDDAEQIGRLSQGAVAAGASIGVVIEIDTMMRRGGVRNIEHAVQLAELATAANGVRFRGVMSHQVPTTPMPSRDERYRQGGAFMDHVLDVKHAIEAKDIAVEVVSTGESWTYDVAKTMPEVTEIEGGSYIVMEVPYSYMTEFHYAAKIIGTVVERPDDHSAVGDVTVEAIGRPNGPPTLEGRADVTVADIDHHGTQFKSSEPMPLAVGDRYTLITHQQDITMNRWDQYVAVRSGVVEATFEVNARGCYH